MENEETPGGVQQSVDSVGASSNLSRRIQNRLQKLNEVAQSAGGDGEASGYYDFSTLDMKPDHEARPVWVCPNGRIFLEAFSPIYKQAYDFLVAISEPVSRPEFCTRLHTQLRQGQARAAPQRVLRESLYPEVLRKLLEHEHIRAARVKETAEDNAANASSTSAPPVAPGGARPEDANEFIQKDVSAEDQANLQYQKLLNEDYNVADENHPGKSSGGQQKTVRTVSFKIRKTMVEQVKRACLDLDYPLMEEYDFRNDKTIPDLEMDLNPRRESVKVMQLIQGREWGCILLDEVHVVPAKMFRKVIGSIACHCKLGLTATLVREDDLIGDLNFLIGPKLYEANWMDLTQSGFLANVSCVEVWCPMAGEFYREYLRETKSARKRALLYVANPNKFTAAEFLIQYHEERGDKILLFSDDVFALRLVVALWLATTRGAASRTYSAPKANATGGFNAFFYTLISTDTHEMFYSNKRQQYLVDQGYTFKVVTDLFEPGSFEGVFTRKEDQRALLNEVLSADVESAAKDENAAIRDDEDLSRLELSGHGRKKKKLSSLGALSGADGTKYMEYSAGHGAKQRHNLFRDRYR
ncbi:ERCC3/RAD25/XPB helicase, C-terminal domain [Phytophthora cactorum]|nr:ERCC3/RAD25/XPB helicase, C-terminal domain [Phytophthora cactorum]